jgi:hypothetical protein
MPAKNPVRFLLLIAFLGTVSVAAAAATANRLVEAAEPQYADFLDAAGAIATLDAGLVTRFDGLDRAGWQARFDRSLAGLNAALAAIPEQVLSAHDRRALNSMRSGIAFRTGASLAPAGNCADAGRAEATGRELRTALYACFSSVGDAIEFEGRRYTRAAALGLLERLAAPQRRRALFMAMAPLWHAVNGADTPDSPYRRMVAAEAAHARANITDAEASLGLAPGAGERWLEQALEAWRSTVPNTPIEPWDFRYGYARGPRAVQSCAHDLQRATGRFFDDLGANLPRLQVLEDIDARAGKAPVDYTDFARIGRRAGGAWRPAIPRVSVLMAEDSLGSAYELAHEYGHAVHYAAIRARPALLLPDDFSLAAEAFADIPGWSVYSAQWQRSYLGCASTAADARQALLANVMLDIAWAWFESRMARTPASDPNVVWTQITSRYLHIAPHPEISWWAVRGQLVDDPGYMITYGLGAFVTADLRARIRAAIGEFDAGNGAWYRYVRARLFRQGGELEPQLLLGRFLGRPVAPQALLTMIGEFRPPLAPAR